MTFHVDSEVGRLRQVILHKPGLELSRLTPTNVEELLFDDVMWADRARAEHDAFVAQLRDRGVVVHHFHDLLAEALDQPGSPRVPAGQADHGDAVRAGPGQALGPARRVDTRRAAGRAARRRRPEARPRAVPAHVEPVDGVPRRRRLPLAAPARTTCSSATTRRGSTSSLSINPMAKQARKRETINSRLVYNFHPKFRDAGIDIIYGNDSLVHERATVEGGDVLVIGNGSVMIGMGERTTPQGVETLARLLFRGHQVDRVIVVELPKVRAFMHLDTALTMVDRDAFSVYPYLPDALRSFTLTPLGDDGEYSVQENAELRPRRRRGARHRQGQGPPHADRPDGRATRAVGRRQQLPGVVAGGGRGVRAQHDDEPLPGVRGHRGDPSRGLGARAWPGRPSVHDLPDRERRRVATGPWTC